MTAIAPKPWYREPWPWLLMMGPFIVVVAGINMAVVAFRTSDGLVADDYYKQGLGINRVIEREARAKSLGLGASVTFNGDRSAVRVVLASKAAIPEGLRLTLVHPTRNADDHVVDLAPVAPGVYEGALTRFRAATYHVHLQDAAGTWRLAGRWRGSEDRVVIGD